MVVMKFHLLGKDPLIDANLHLVEIDITHDLDAAQSHVADSFSIVDPKGVGFQTKDATSIPDMDELLDAEQPIAVTVDGHAVRKVPGPEGMPIVGNHYQVYPDHIGNNHRLFATYGPTIQHTDAGKTWYLTSDPAVASQMFLENEFWSKQITAAHPLFGAKDNLSGLFLNDTNTENNRIAHKFLPPALSPKAVRHYLPMTQNAAEESFKVFDQFADGDEAFDVFPYMFKLASQAVAKLILNTDLHHFDNPDAPLSNVVTTLVELLTLIKRISSRPTWYAHLPFGDPKKLRDTQHAFSQLCSEAIKKAQQKGGPDLPIATAALEAESMADFVARAVDENGNRMPEEVALTSLPIVIGAGFTTTASLLSWMAYGVADNPKVQEKLLQELIDHGATAETRWNYDSVNDLHYLDKYIKETQRMFNPAFQPARTALRDQIIPGGFEIPKGATMVCSLHALHRNPKVWDDPTTFNPDRWDTEKVRNRPANSYIPFATGPRSCIGFNFALGEARTMFATLLYRYEFKLYGDEPIDYDKEFITYRPTNLYIRIKRRTSWPAKSQ